jgi:hypothetical protein
VSRHGTLMLGLVLGLAWSGPASARAAKPRPRAIEAPVEAPEEPLDPALDPALDEAEPEPGEAPIDPPLDEGEAVQDPAIEEHEEPVEPPLETEPPAPSTAPASTHDVPADDFEAESGVAPGGYYGHGVILERAPPDGRNRIIVGSILLPLGTIATVSSAVGTYMTVPSHCAERLGAATGIEATASKCQGLFTFNVIRTSYGALMLGAGATILALGMIQRERYRKWRHEHGMRARLEPTVDFARSGAAVGLRLRF